MSKQEWYLKLVEWAHTDSRLGRLPYVLMEFLAEHLAEHDAAEQSVQADGAYCECNPNEAPYKVGSKICAVCEKPRR